MTNQKSIVTVPSILEQKIMGTPITTETRISRAELRTLFYVGRKLELIACLMGPTLQARTVKAPRSYGYDMEKPDGNVSNLRFESGQWITAVSPAGNGYTEVKVFTAEGELAAHYRLL